jgi:hypothetical protein
VPATDQAPGIRHEAPEKAGGRVIRAERMSGTSAPRRHGRRAPPGVIRPGDERLVARADRRGDHRRHAMG